LVVEQNLQFAIKIAKKVSILSMGKVVYESTAEEIAKREDIQTSYLSVSQG
jgi:ABC-type branched-subunit amino acid transport system ATPase component